MKNWIFRNDFVPLCTFVLLHNVHFSKKPIHVFSPGHVSAQKEFVMTSISKYFRNSEILAHLNTKHKTMSQSKTFKICVGKRCTGCLNMLCPTLQMLTDKLLINYYFHMLLLQVKICKLFKSGWLLILQTIICFFCCLVQNYMQTTDR